MLHLCQDAQKQGGKQDFFVGREAAMNLQVSAVHSSAGQRELGGPSAQSMLAARVAAPPRRSGNRGAEAW